MATTRAPVSPFDFLLDAGGLPDGLGIGNNGEITGTPTAVGIFTFTVRMNDAR